MGVESCFFSSKNDDGSVRVTHHFHIICKPSKEATHHFHLIRESCKEMVKTTSVDIPANLIKKIQSKEMREAFRQWCQKLEPELHPPRIFDPEEWGYIYEFHFREENLFIGFITFEYDQQPKIAFGRYDTKKIVFFDRWCYQELLNCDV
jgi:hypothetical protein